MIIDKETDDLMNEWSKHIQVVQQKPLVLFTLSQSDGAVNILKINELSDAQIVDMCERVASIYREKLST